MASNPRFQGPPGHPSQVATLLAARLAGIAVSLDAPDADLAAPVLEAGGAKVVGGAQIAEHLAKAWSGALYPEGDSAAQAQIDVWIQAAGELELAGNSWLPPTCAAPEYTDAVRDDAKKSILAALGMVETALGSGAYLVGDSMSMADVQVVAHLARLLPSVVGAADIAAAPKTQEYLQRLAGQEAVAAILGPVSLNAGAGWVVPGGDAGKKKKGKGGAGGEAPAGQPTAQEEDDPEKAARKAAKLAEKEAKKAKAAAKAAAAAAAKEKAAAGDGGKKAKAKEEAEAKKAAEAAEVQRIVDAARATPAGAKKNIKADMPKAYCPPAVEAAWYEWWEKSGFFKPDMDSDKPPFVVVIPPPNVTGTLHLGHALTNAIQDTLVRWRRMSGYNALWVPGTDHAGIATQTVVEKKLQREQGITRHDLGREKFLEEVYKWVDIYGGRICDQLRRIGSSVDWDRKTFTMDENRSAAVLEAFVRMYESGKIYRDNRLVNWCCTLKTAVSDIEVDYIDVPGRTMISVPGYKEPVEFGVLLSFAYPLDGEEGEVVVATTRIETMLGDTGVAIHPEDDRYKHLHGKFVVHPVDGRKIPIICDAELVDMAFGTGCVKITPAHDPNDFATGKRHSLEFINIFDDVGKINARGGPFEGQARFEARRTVTEFLKEKGLYRGTEPNTMRLGLCSRSKDVIEPLLKPQWWVDCKQMAADGCEAVRDGRLEIIPAEFESTWFRWLENIRDWCVSRQLWWGHRIPAYYCQLDGDASEPGSTTEEMAQWVVGRTPEEAEANAAKKFPGKKVTLVQDEDVLDTWFSSGLFPFSVFNWPNQTADLAKFYPTSLLETGHDILFFWVARMVMMGMALTDQVPFKQVYLHSMVRDAHGRKMSKSLGNVIDPIHVIEGISLEGLGETLEGGNLDQKEVAKAKAGQKVDFPDGIEECGTDALRFALCAYTSQARDINLDIKRVVAYRYWCNKLWNAIKFAMLNLDDAFVPQSPESLDVKSLPFACRWVVSRLNAAVSTTVSAMEVYNFSDATTAVYAFWQYEVCDVFIELMKPVMAKGPEAEAEKFATRTTLWLCLDYGLKLLHPFMPFVTEELWQRLPQPAGASVPASIMIADYPKPMDAWKDGAVEAEMAYAQDIVGKIRGLRSDYNLTKQKPHVYIACSSPERAASLTALSAEIATLTTSSAAEVLAHGAPAPSSCGIKICDEATTVHMLLKGVLDPEIEIKRLEKKQSELANKAAALQKKMGMPSYEEKTPEHVKEADMAALEKNAVEQAAASAALEGFRAMLN